MFYNKEMKKELEYLENNGEDKIKSGDYYGRKRVWTAQRIREDKAF